MEYDNNNDDGNNDMNFVAERNVYERVAKGGAGEMGIDQPGFPLRKMFMTDKEIFMLSIREALSLLEENQHLNLGPKITEEISEIADKIPRIKYKNALAFILGLYVLDKNTTEISSNRFNNLLNNVIPSLTSFGLAPQDVLRYARMIKIAIST